jgi:inhibitor of KinA sporulation pathway (predicted exonuclease)
MLQTHRALDDARMAAQVYREVLRDRAEVQVADESRLVQEDGF